MSELIDAHVRHCRTFLAPKSVDDRARLLHRLDDALPMGLGMATTEELEDFLADPKFSRATKATYHSHLVEFFKWACDPKRPQIDYDPSVGLRRVKVPQAVPKPALSGELEFALAVLPDPWRVYVLLAAYAGARCCEIAVIEREEITDKRVLLHGKGDRDRYVGTHPDLWAAVQHFPAGRIARKVGGGNVTPGYVSTETGRKLRQIGINRSLHRFRAWYCTMQLRPEKFGGAGASMRTVQENAGHARLETTAIYTLVENEEREAAILALPSFTRPST